MKRYLLVAGIALLCLSLGFGIWMLSFYESTGALVTAFSFSALLGFLWARGIEIMLGVK